MKVGVEQPEEQNRPDATTSDRRLEARWLRITEIVGVAWELPASSREAYVTELCKNDDSMRAEVRRLLEQLADPSALLQTGLPSIGAFAPPEIAPGTLIGRYRVQDRIGEGGMGIVYGAVDERLQRLVALKVLRFRLVDPQFRQRLLREAQMAAALSHPNIVTVYDTGSSGDIDFIAMEYLSGTALDKVISREPPGFEDAIRYAEQIASALAKAHAAGIVHRDLKPGNVILTEDGVIKVLDFGLAKRLEAPLDPVLSNMASADAQCPPADPLKTAYGAVLGTVTYMSPEQARGDSVDERSDIFSFGAILFELISGRKAFIGANQHEILTSIQSGRAPNIRDLVGRIPRKLDALISKCMQNEASRRPRAAEIATALQALRKPRSAKAWLAAAAMLTILAAGAVFFRFKHPGPVAEAQLSARPLTSDPGDEISNSFSPSGKDIVYAWRRENENSFNLYRMPISGGTSSRLTKTTFDDFSPAWSPDGREIAFIRGSSGKPGSIFVIPAVGGLPRKLARLSTTPWIFLRDLDWSPDNKWLAFADEDQAGGWDVFELAPQTGERRTLAQPARGANYLQPAFSPDGRTLAFIEDRDGVSGIRLLRLKRDGNPEQASWPLRLRGFENAISSSPMWRDNGRQLLFISNKNGSSGQLWTVDIKGSEDRELIPEMAGSLGEGTNLPAISRKEKYLSFTRLTEDKDIWRVNLSGPETGQLTRLISSTRQETFPQYSPDGRRIVFESDRSGFPEIWVSNADGTDALALTNFNGPVTGSPSWSPDSTEVAFDSRAAGTPEVFAIRAEPGSKPWRVTMGGGPNILPDWSADGRSIFFVSSRTGDARVWRAPAKGGPAEQVTSGFAFAPQASPDGKYLYFMAGRASSAIRRFDLTTKRETRIVALTNERSFAITSRGVYYLHNTDAHTEVLRFWNARTNQDTSLARITGRLAGGLSVSQDNRFALLVKDDRGGNRSDAC